MKSEENREDSSLPGAATAEGCKSVAEPAAAFGRDELEELWVEPTVVPRLSACAQAMLPGEINPSSTR
jgi:hypothetical protein